MSQLETDQNISILPNKTNSTAEETLIIINITSKKYYLIHFKKYWLGLGLVSIIMIFLLQKLYW